MATRYDDLFDRPELPDVLPEHNLVRDPVSGNYFRLTPEEMSAWTPRQPRPEPEPAPAEPEETEWADYGRLYMAGSAQLASGAGWLLKKFGLEDVGGQIETLGNDAVEEWNSRLTPAMQKEMAKQFVVKKDDGGYEWGDAGLKTALAMGVQSVPGTMLGMGVGGGITKVLQTFANPVGRAALVKAVTAGSVEAAKKLKVVDSVIGATGFGIGEGSISAVIAGPQIKEAVLRMDPEKLLANPRYQEILASTDDRMSELEKHQYAAETIADEAASAGALHSGLVVSLFGAPMGAFFGRLMSKPLAAVTTRPRAAAIGALGEAAQEFAQSGTEQIISNVQVRKAGDTDVGVLDDVLNQAVGGAIAGAALGGTFGAAEGPAITDAGSPPAQTVPPKNREDIIKSVRDRVVAAGVSPEKAAKIADSILAGETELLPGLRQLRELETAAKAAPAPEAEQEVEPTGVKVEAVEPGQPVVETAIDAEAHEAAPSPLNDRPEPTDGQRDAGNYRKGHVRIQGLNISIENPAGSVRTGTGEGGRQWSVTMPRHYGYIRGTVGKDKDHIDVTLGEAPEDEARKVYVVDQGTPTAKVFDEHKVMLGFDSREAALSAYREQFSEDVRNQMAANVVGVAEFSVPEFKTWLAEGDHQQPATAWTGTPAASVISPETAISDQKQPEIGEKEAETGLPVATQTQPIGLPASPLSVTFGGKTYPVASVEDAAEKWGEFRQAAVEAGGGGVSEIGNGVEVKDQAGNVVGRVAYNGRVLRTGADVAREEHRRKTELAKPLYDRAESIRFDVDKKGRNHVEIKIVQRDDGRWDYALRVDLPTSGEGSPFSMGDGFESREAAVESGKAQARRFLESAAKTTVSTNKPDIMPALVLLKKLGVTTEPEPTATAEAVETEAEPPEQASRWDAMDYGQRQAIAEVAYKGMRKVIHRISGSRWAQLGEGEGKTLAAAMAAVEPEAEEAAEPEPRKAAVKAQTRREAERELFLAALTLPAVVEAADAEDFRKVAETAVAKWLAAEVEKADPDRAAVLKAISVGDKFYAGLAVEAKRAAKKAELDRNRDPEVYVNALREAIQDAGISQGTQAFGDGFAHAMAGKTKSTLAGDLMTTRQRGYEAGTKWRNTDEGRAWYTGKRRQKLEGTGATLRRWMDKAKETIAKSTATELEAAWADIEASVERGNLFDPQLPADASPGVRSYVDALRNKITPFKQHAKSSVLGQYYGRKNGRKKSFDDLLARRAEQADPKHVKQLLEEADKYVSAVGGLSAALDGVTTVAGAAAALEKIYLLPAETGTSYRRSSEAGTALSAFMRRSLDNFMGTGYFVRSFQRGENDAAAKKQNRTPLIPPKLDRVERRGVKDHRRGKDISPKQFKNTFGFKDVGFGKWVNARQDQDHLNYAYDAFMDLAELLNIPAKAISLGGQLHFTIGALGHGKHAAHYAPAQPHPDGGTVPVINVTNTKGDGTVAHEWMHALDWALRANLASDSQHPAVARLVRSLQHAETDFDAHWESTIRRFLSGESRWQRQRGWTTKEHARHALVSTYYDKPGDSNYNRESKKLEGSGDPYWSTDHEMLARASEAWVFDLLDSQRTDDLGKRNTYLVNPWVGDGVTKAPIYRGQPYPADEERKRFAEGFADFFKAIEWTDAGPVLSQDALAKLDPKVRFTEAREAAGRRFDEIVAIYEAETAAAGRAKELSAIEAKAETERAAAEAERAAAAAVKTDPMGQLSEDELSDMFDDVAAGIREAAQEKPDDLGPGASSAIRERDPVRRAEVEKSAGGLIADAAKMGVRGADEALTGLAKLFGGGKINSFPSFDEKTYAEAKPHFEEALRSFQASGKSLRELFAMLIKRFGEGIKPYLIRFARDSGLTAELSQAPTPTMQVAKWVVAQLNAGNKVGWSDLFEQADTAFGGTQAEGKYTPKDAYDAMEAGVNLYLRSGNWYAAGNAGQAARDVNNLKRVLDTLPTQTKRTPEMDEFQQFSTPPSYAYVVNWLANIKRGETVLEPSAGIGGLAIFAEAAGAKLVLNELSKRRLEVLRSLFPGARVFSEDGAQLDNILPADITPAVVIMNPPFSATAGRVQGRRDTMEGARHIEQALGRLAENGRLVAIVGEGMAADRPAFKEWWAKIRGEYTVLANVGVDGSGYAKYGTTFDNQIIVIDKTGPTKGDVITGKVDDVSKLPAMLEGVRDGRRTATQPGQLAEPGTAEPGLPEAPEAGDEESGVPAQPQSGQAGVGVEPGRRAGRDAGPAGRLEPEGGTGLAVRGRSGGRPPARRGQPEQGDDGGGGEPDVGPATQPDGGARVTAGEAEARTDELTDSIFEQYRPARVRVAGAKQHRGALVESAAMASVFPPAPKYTPNLPADIIESGAISLAQIEAVIYAGQSHQEIMPNGQRRGFLIGDGTGVGKGREISAILMDNYRQGRRRSVWISENNRLMADAQRDMADIGFKAQLHQLKGPYDPIRHRDGILFTSYSTMRSAQSEKGRADKTKPPKRRLDQIIQWLGPDFDGVIVFDESHNMANAQEVKGARGAKKPSQTAIAGSELQTALPKARIVYVSATAATEVVNLAYASRLGLWGEKTAFANAKDFVSRITTAGVAAMEVVARDMKALGMYLARSLSYEGVGYSRALHELTPLQIDAYNVAADAWQTVLNNLGAALKATNQAEDGRAKGAAMSQFWGSHQRFFNQLITAMQMPTVLEAARKDLEAGHAVVMQLVNTNEAEQERKAAAAEEDEEGDVGLEFGPMDGLIQYVSAAFPTIQYEESTDSEGNTIMVPVRDSEGNAVMSKEAIKIRDGLLENLKAIAGSQAIPGNPLDLIIEEFGPAMVAEATGRGRRFVRVRHGDTVKVEEQRRGDQAVKADVEAFQADRKRVLVFSQAAGTGVSFHADLAKAKNLRLRRHYLVQPGWRADKAMQGFGRTHRTNQKQPPEYILVTTDLKAQKRFVSSIARRLDQLGALTKGERKTASQGLFSAEDNLESQYSIDAQLQFWKDLHAGAVEGLNFEELSGKMGLGDMLDEKTGGISETKVPTIQRFLNRLLSLNVELQGVVFDAYFHRMEELVAKAVENGTYDVGLETLHAISTEKTQEDVVYTDERTGAVTRYVRLEQTKAVSSNPWSEISETAKAVRGAFSGFYRDNQTGEIFAVINRGKRFTTKGDVLTKGQRWGVTGAPRYIENVDNIEAGGEPRMIEREGPVFTGEAPQIEGLPYYAAPTFIRKFNQEGEAGMRRLLEADYAADSYRAGQRPAVEKLIEHIVANATIGMAERRGHRYEKIGDADSVEAEEAWTAAHDAAAKTRTETVHMITGVVLPIWDRFSADEKTRVARAQTVGGERLLGRVLREDSLADVLKRLGVNPAARMDAAEIQRRILAGQVATLVNGWILKKSRVSNEDRIEITKPTGFSPGETALLKEQGAFAERIQWSDRYFIPTAEPGVLARILSAKPVAELSGNAMFSRRGPQPFIGYLAADGSTESFDEAAAAAADYHHNFLMKDPGKFDVDSTLSFVRMGSEPAFTLKGDAVIDPYAPQSRAQIRALSRFLLESGADPAAPLKVADMGLPKSEARHQGREIGRVADWAGGMYARRGDVSQPFYSELLRTVENSKQASATAAQWMGTLRNAPGVKAEEMDWVGVEEWLGEQTGPVTREALADYINANQLVVSETVLGGVDDLSRESISSMQEEQRMIVRQIEAAGYRLTVGAATGPTLFNIETDEDYDDIDDVPHNIRPLIDRYVVLDAEQGRAGYLSDEAAEQIESDKIVKFGNWVSEGPKTGYRELLITLPQMKSDGAMGSITFDDDEKTDDFLSHISAEGMERLDYGRVDDGTTVDFEGLTPADMDRFKRIAAQYDGSIEWETDPTAPAYRSPHFDVDNIIAHVRFDERFQPDPSGPSIKLKDGKGVPFVEGAPWKATDQRGFKTLFIEEIQSDWHQEGRREGYAKDTTGWTAKRLNDPDAGFNHWQILDAAGNEVTKIVGGGTDEDAIRKAAEGVPDAPFKTTWPQLAMKRMIRWAAENGFDRIAWTPGAEQIGRYRLSRKGTRLLWTKHGTSGSTPMAAIEGQQTGNLYVLNENGTAIESKYDLTEDQLAQEIGAELADKLLKQPGESQSSAGVRTIVRMLDAKVDRTPQALPRFYDQELVYVANKLVKKYGGKVGPIVFNLPRRPQDTSFAEVSRMTETERMEAHGFDMTPALREAAMAGQPLFQRPPAAPAAGGMKAADVEAGLAKPLSALRQLGIDISIVQSVRDVGQAVPSDVEGVYFEGTNRVALVADNLPSLDVAQRKVVHEVFGHLAAERHPAFREAIAAVIRMHRIGAKDINALWAEVQRTHGHLDDTTHAKEVIALMAERGADAPLFTRLVQAVRAFIRSLGIDLEFTEADIRDFIRAAARNLNAEATRRDLLKWHPEAERALSSVGASAASVSAAIAELYPTPLMDSQLELERELNAVERAGRDPGRITALKAALRRTPMESEADLLDRLPSDPKAAVALGIEPVPLYSRRAAPMSPGLEAVYSETMAEPADSLPARDRIRAFVQRIKATDWLTVKQGIVDSYASILALEKGQFGAVLDASESAYKAALATQNHASVMAAVFIKGVPDYINGALQMVPGRKGFIEIFERLTNHPDGNLVKHWKLWAAANRANRLIGEDRERNFTQAQIDEALLLGEQYPFFAEILADWQEINRRALDLAEKAGVIDGTTRKLWEKNDYVPFFRVFDEIEAGPNLKGGLQGQRSPIKRLHGGEARVNDIVVNMAMNLSTLIDRAHKNIAMERITALADGIAMNKVPLPWRSQDYEVDDVQRAFEKVGIDIGKLSKEEREEYITLFHRVAPRGKDIVSVMRKGRAVYYRVTDPLLLRSITSLGPDTTDGVLAIFGGAKRLLTGAVTADPAFMLANYIRDTLSNWVVAGASFHPLTGPIKGAKASLAQDDVLFKLMMAGGGGGGYYESQPDEVRKLLAEKMPEGQVAGFMKTVITPKRAWKAWKRIGAATENANRLATFQSVIEVGGSVAEAAYRARDVLNFTMRGDFAAMRVLIATVPFMNARVQGLYRLYRGARDNPRAFAIRGLILMAATAALMLRNQDEKEYEELQEWDKDAYWHFFVGGEHYRLPKPFEVGILFASLPERIWRFGTDRDSSRILFRQIESMIGDTLAFNPIPQLVKPVLEQYANRNSFTGAPIVGMSMRGLTPEAQYNAWTSETMRAMSDALPDWAPEWLRSPVRLQAAIRGYTGALGSYAIGTADYAVREIGNYPEPPTSSMYDLPVLRRFMRDPNPKTTKYAGEMYEMLDEADAIYRTVKVYRERGELDRAADLLQENRGKIMMRGRLNALALQVRNINNQINMLQFSELPADEKRRRIDALQERKNEITGRVAGIAEYF